MKLIVLGMALALGSAAAVWSQTAQAVPQPAPLPAESTQKIADGSPAAPATAPAAADITVWDYLKMLLILGLVLGMIWGFVWFMRRLSGQGQRADPLIRVLHSHTLSGSRTLQVVEVGPDVLLVGTGDAGVTLVKDLTGTEAADAFRLASSQSGPGSRTKFGDLVAELLGFRPRLRPDISAPADNSSDFLKKQRERLKKL